MRSDMIRIEATKLVEGMTICFHNKAMDYVIERVSDMPSKQIKIEACNLTRTEFLEPSDYVFIKRGV